MFICVRTNAATYQRLQSATPVITSTVIKFNKLSKIWNTDQFRAILPVAATLCSSEMRLHWMSMSMRLHILNSRLSQLDFSILELIVHNGPTLF